MEAGAYTDEASQQELERFMAFGEILLSIEIQSADSSGQSADNGGRVGGVNLWGGDGRKRNQMSGIQSD